MPDSSSSKVVIIGAGLAGLFTALKLAPLPAMVVAQAPLGEGASSVWAQGGIAAALGEDDTPEAHARDTIAAGDGLVDEAVAQAVATEAGLRVRDLLGYGVPFDRDPAGQFQLSREAAHSAARVARVSGDGAAIMQALIAQVRATPSIEVLEGYAAQRLLSIAGRVTGVEFARENEPAAVYHVTGARAVVLATGGIGGLYALSTSPLVARGAGIALAAQAGCVIADAEFVAFHPTVLDVGVNPAPLEADALCGRGAVLVNKDGVRFMRDVHEDAELAPRDVVARAVFAEVQAGRGAFLDCAAIGAGMATAFPTVTATALAAGIDPVTQLIPVAPAAHFHMGGVKTDALARTRAPGLFAVGEVAATGLHGADRLASNAPIEAAVFGARAAATIAGEAVPTGLGATTLTRRMADRLADEGARAAAYAIIRATMSANAGVVRSGAGLRTALDSLAHVEAAADGDPAILNAVIAARFVVEAALRRKESRGAHFRSDHPQHDARAARSSSITLAGLALRSAQGARAALGGL